MRESDVPHSVSCTKRRAKVDELRERGVEFMVMSKADGDPVTTDERGVAAQEGLAVAWMLDPDGQVLMLFELT